MLSYIPNATSRMTLKYWLYWTAEKKHRAWKSLKKSHFWIFFSRLFWIFVKKINVFQKKFKKCKKKKKILWKKKKEKLVIFPSINFLQIIRKKKIGKKFTREKKLKNYFEIEKINGEKWDFFGWLLNTVKEGSKIVMDTL